MDSRSKLECDVHDWLDEPNLMSLLPIVHLNKARDLVSRMRACAERAKNSGSDYDECNRRLTAAAESLDRKIQADMA